MSEAPKNPVDVWDWYTAARRRYYRSLAVTVTLWLGFGFLAVGEYLTGWWLLPLFLAFGVAGGLTSVLACHIWSWRCPAYGKSFVTPVFGWPGLRCSRCGMRVGSRVEPPRPAPAAPIVS
jgi:hypothetical protein